MTPSTKRCASIFDLAPHNAQNLLPKICTKSPYKSACMADRPEMFAPTKEFSGMADSMEPCKMLWGRPLLPWQRHLGSVRRSSRLPVCSPLCLSRCICTYNGFHVRTIWIVYMDAERSACLGVAPGSEGPRRDRSTSSHA